ncbi:Glutathione S-transferase, N-terminal domain protein [Synechococcus sp. PCC 7335]|uniref:glutathione S-transferase family protein n=1 Tax=Synechococcus sp. (strain ATCC 29403 / PCC 7335) TaxID=91464 RepID=UPI00017EE4A2|nr:glutathione S-transferase family protein [Synechococcus sp. PCC 7335]EDX83528.1 Glutathione S-transferase, N-terminal domain protein [Synechococcus sp. PCC 7335]
MLKFYYHPISINARRVWVALLEKQIAFEPILIDLSGEQFSEEFSAINPLQRVPVIDDEGFRVIESLAILDYLEAKHPTPALMPTEPEAIVIVRMVEMITVGELQSAMFPLTRPAVGLEVEAHKLEAAQQRVTTILDFFETLLGNKPYFAGSEFTRAEVVTGTMVSSLPLEGHPRLKEWATRLADRESWQQTEAQPEDIEAALPLIKDILKRRS